MLVVSGGCAGMLLYFGAVHLSPAVGELTASIQLRTRPSSPLTSGPWSIAWRPSGSSRAQALGEEFG